MEMLGGIFIFEDEPWRKLAKCRGMDNALFFPERGEPTEPAKAVCRECPVTQECGEYAVSLNAKSGIWGGKSHRQRRAERKEELASLSVD